MKPAPIKNPGEVSSRTLGEVFIARHGCTPKQFRKRVFWRTLHFQAVLLAPLLLLGHHFAADFELISACERARSMRSVREEIGVFRHDSRNMGWLRRVVRIRLSTQKLLRLAHAYLEG
jgi:hypothetical protein